MQFYLVYKILYIILAVQNKKMKTILPKAITTIKQAQKFLSQLYKNEESYHPEDDAGDIIDMNDKKLFTDEEAKQLNKLMDDIYDLPGNDGRHVDLVFDPCQWLLDIDINHLPDIEDIDKKQAKELLKVYNREKIINWIKSIDSNASVTDEAQIADYGKPATKPQLKKVFWAIFDEVHESLEKEWK